MVKIRVFGVHPRIFGASIDFVILGIPPAKGFGGAELKMLKRKHWRDDIGRPGQFTLVAGWTTPSCIFASGEDWTAQSAMHSKDIFLEKRILNRLEDALFEVGLSKCSTLPTATRKMQGRTISLSQSGKKLMQVMNDAYKTQASHAPATQKIPLLW